MNSPARLQLRIVSAEFDRFNEQVAKADEALAQSRVAGQSDA